MSFVKRQLGPIALMFLGGWFGFYTFISWAARETPSPAESLFIWLLVDSWSASAIFIVAASAPIRPMASRFSRFVIGLLAWAIAHAIAIPFASSVASIFPDEDGNMVSALGPDNFAIIVGLPIAAAYSLPMLGVLALVEKIGRPGPPSPP